METSMNTAGFGPKSRFSSYMETLSNSPPNCARSRARWSCSAFFTSASSLRTALLLGSPLAAATRSTRAPSKSPAARRAEPRRKRAFTLPGSSSSATVALRTAESHAWIFKKHAAALLLAATRRAAASARSASDASPPSSKSSQKAAASSYRRAACAHFLARNSSVPSDLSALAFSKRSAGDISHFSFGLGPKSCSVTSKRSVASGGILGGEPAAPYA
mmetsp:Transcript_4960/g.17961  ORF Transcript_4960/g.17961 Transcript_4960/m.17961 type:complete len:218 (+) Transcript_4960:1351-2004(+)